ncbi:hypothetical protein Pla52o_47520 [Novipirellula galeiformis]|uniref:Uncharacterized protein n=1 Tax=Novipirellula galeiformis TaxID=2528004 RepID=A0A5C6C882_9BACT|nr:hypothetical protein Pla52o_47520 [Novipirellula galeiformis]
MHSPRIEIGIVFRDVIVSETIPPARHAFSVRRTLVLRPI